MLGLTLLRSLAAGVLVVAAGINPAWADATVPAFPGAEGFGAGASGGRGGEVYYVTNLDDDGPGSLRDAISQPNRMVLFKVSGTIELKSRLSLNQPNITIAGQSAPGDGIALRGRELFITNTENVIVRFLRLRPGDISTAEVDALTIWNAKDVIIDHCSLSWSTDSLNDVVRESGNVTVQWCILSEPLVNSVHAKGRHGYATGWDGRTKGGGSFHHNLIAHAVSRAPRIGYYREGRGQNDCRNNVIYNSGPAYGAEDGDLNFVGNYYRPGPNADLRPAGVHFGISSNDTRLYIAGNIWEGHDAHNRDNRAGVTFGKGRNAGGETTGGSPELCFVDRPFEFAPIRTHTAEQAYAFVLQHAGARLPNMDAVDTRILNDVQNRTGKPIDSQNEVGGWPELKSAEPPIDTDGDGMPDAWERANGLDPNNPADGPRLAEPGGYSNLEIYLNSLVVDLYPKD